MPETRLEKNSYENQYSQVLFPHHNLFIAAEFDIGRNSKELDSKELPIDIKDRCIEKIACQRKIKTKIRVSADVASRAIKTQQRKRQEARKAQSISYH